MFTLRATKSPFFKSRHSRTSPNAPLPMSLIVSNCETLVFWRRRRRHSASDRACAARAAATFSIFRTMGNIKIPPQRMLCTFTCALTCSSLAPCAAKLERSCCFRSSPYCETLLSGMYKQQGCRGEGETMILLLVHFLGEARSEIRLRSLQTMRVQYSEGKSKKRQKNIKQRLPRMHLRTHYWYFKTVLVSRV